MSNHMCFLCRSTFSMLLIQRGHVTMLLINKHQLMINDFCDVKHFAAPKEGVTIIRGGAIFEGKGYSTCVFSV